MSKAADIAKASAKGSFNFLWGLVISTLISAIGTIIIARLLGPGNYGLYTIVMYVVTLIVLFRDWGINSAMVRFTAQYKAENRLSEIRSIFISGLIFEIALGLILSTISFTLSGFLATTVFSRPELAPLIQIASFSILASGLINAATAAFTGFEEMQLNSIMLICQSTIKTLATIALVISLIGVGLETSGAVIGFTVGTFIAGLIGILLMWTIYKKLPTPTMIRQNIASYIKEMFKYGMPLSLALIISGSETAFYQFLLPIRYPTDNMVIGNYGIAVNFVVLIGFFATPITTMLFPAFSKLNPQKDKEALKNVFQSSVKYASFLVVPVAALVMCLSGPAVSTLFGETYTSAPLFLSLLALNYMLSALGILSMGTFINGQGQTTYNLKLNILTAAIGFPLGFVLIMQFGVLGLLAATLTSGIPTLLIGLRWIKKHYEATVDWRSSAKILLSATITATVTYLIVSLLSFSSWIRLVIGVIIFIIVFLGLVLLTRAITSADINNLRDMTNDIGFVGKLMHHIFNLLEKLMKKLRLDNSSLQN